MARIDLRTAVQSVKNYISEYRDILGNNLKDLKIEETELSEDEKFWLITVSYIHEISAEKQKKYENPIFSGLSSGLAKTQTFDFEQDYKTFKVDASNGEILSMKMYKL